MDVSRLRQLALSDSGFVFDPVTGHTFTVNAAGLIVLSALKEGQSTDAIVKRLRDEMEMDGSEDVARDVDDFLARLAEQGLAG
ncbi:MAG: HPr-rel-A system PqqD family peptide chaperone [Myxococcales bacterium]|nr:HPr-rel-A system PqqD family peptide chaperone [Myxococcales bacterium]MCB9578617.1 HPr-rel-A system PqqD family peptide chaperone [Polyangiaceae bacterium]